MTISIVYHTRFGNNAAIAQRLSDKLESLGHGVSIHPISEARSSEIPAADLYLVGSPTQIGTLPLKMGRFLKKMAVREGSRYGAFATWAESGSSTPAKLEAAMNDKGATRACKTLILGVKDLRGPIEEGWEIRCDNWAEEVAGAVHPDQNE